MNYKQHFQSELDIIKGQSKGLSEEETPIILRYEQVFNDFFEALEAPMDEEGLSGGSAPFYNGILVNTLKQVLNYKPLSPLTGEPEEWRIRDENWTVFPITDNAKVIAEELDNILGECKGSIQNIRNSAVFMNKEGKGYFIDAIVFQGEDEHDTFTGKVEDVKSRQVFNKFPFTPKTFYIDVYRVPYDKEIHKDMDYTECGSGDFVYFIKDRSQVEKVYNYYNN